MTQRTAAACAIAITAAFAQTLPPVEQVWVKTPAGIAKAAQSVAPEVHSVRTDSDFVYITSAGLSLLSFGALQTGPTDESKPIRRFDFRIPRKPVPNPSGSPAPSTITGVFITGMPIWNPTSGPSYHDGGIWHVDPVAMPGHTSGTSPLLTTLLARNTEHSPIIGYALDGFPVYGPYGWNATRQAIPLRSGYQLRRHPGNARRTLPDSTALTPAQDGPAVSPEFPGGIFVEDYEYVPHSGDLDRHNGRFAITPEYPDGTYAYFLATNSTATPTYPYLIGPTLAGQLNTVPQHLTEIGRDTGLSFNASTTTPKVNDELTWLFNTGTSLEKVHEKPLHLLVISADLARLDHVHPEPRTATSLLLKYRFTKPGKYWIYADFTPAGAPQTIARFQLDVAGDPVEPAAPETSTVRATLVTSEPTLRTSRDITLKFNLTDEKTGAPVEDLQPYLGAWGHILLISQDANHFLHAHPKEDQQPGADPWKHSHAAAIGPSPSTIETTAGFRRPGMYRVWLQIQRAGKVETLPFVLNVEDAPPPASPTSAQPVPADAIRVEVSKTGYTPARLTIGKGKAATLAFTRKDAENCRGKIVFPTLNIQRDLPPGQTTLVH
ncbi:MAG: YHYH protein, partial [Bryobacteraceae bacterium]|nr:YHYH protein [Bryobacteraceae bacterium]